MKPSVNKVQLDPTFGMLEVDNVVLKKYSQSTVNDTRPGT